MGLILISHVLLQGDILVVKRVGPEGLRVLVQRVNIVPDLRAPSHSAWHLYLRVGFHFLAKIKVLTYNCPLFNI